jgi:hypothetical protein
LAFEGSNYYSTVGIFKYTNMPTIMIENLNNNEINAPCSSLIGKYSYPIDDMAEKELEYKFDIYKNNILLESSGWCVHNVNATKDTYVIESNLFTDEYYTVSDLETMRPVKHSLPLRSTVQAGLDQSSGVLISKDRTTPTTTASSDTPMRS